MSYTGVRAHLIEIRQVLADLRYPAERWQVIAEAQYYGAGSECITRLVRLPVRSYANIDEVTRELPGGSESGRWRLHPSTRQQQRSAA